MDLNIFRIFVTLFALVISITIHELAHAASAVYAGDDTPRKQGRISLNPIDHFDPIGFMMVVFTTVMGFGIGWGKPVQVNPYNFKNPRWDDVKISAWGPLSNIILAVISAGVLRTSAHLLPEGLVTFFIIMVFVNIALALFNLIPVYPLDGSHIMTGLLPAESARSYARFMGQYGIVILMLLLVTGGVRYIIGPPREILVSILFRGI